ncbi:ankyrin repeat domain-containing protein [Propioniciclava sp. MC1595]|uniref:ankyrin repeat domain-containing protein n=1 Tax=Propioniciclava sp. MC1595 TaxID=2760308 RepID=UPI0016627803|nr:ankyrin repeat domain-containing protein [Propioniciclava sp. MC1595]MBB1496151.1 ankyrin repeat domain-containing protein [Propioniciclava sp. MC1595]QTE25738.1 ankyrin repeat domain-containing protein [Propioniciclava sp. MC1595]
MELLLREGAPIDGVRRIDEYDDNLQHWETPLLTACVDHRDEVVEALIRFGAAVDAPNAVRYPSGGGFGHTALHMLVVRRDRVGAQRLMSAGADINRQTTLGTTPLWYAANNDDPEMVTMLLGAGARPDLPDFKGSFPTDCAGPKTQGMLQAAMTERAQQAQAQRSRSLAESTSGPKSDALSDGSRDSPAQIVAIALGDEHGLALRRDGTIVTWGNAYTTPPGLSGVTAIAAGKSHSLALKSDGTVVAWGHGNQGQTDVPAGLAGVVAIAAGLAHNLALKSDGTVVAWGFNDAGQADVPSGLAGVTAIAAGAWHNLALLRDGHVVAWGHPDSDQRHVPHWLRGAVGIAAGYENSSAVLADGTVVDWGVDANFGPLPSDFVNVASIAYGWRHRLALRKDGTVAADGGEMGGLIIPSGLTEVVAIAGSVIADHRSFLALRRDGTIALIKHPVVDYRTQGAAQRGVARAITPAMDIPVELTRLPTVVRQTAGDDHPHAADAVRPIRDPDLALEDIELLNGKTALMHWAAIGDEGKVQSLLAGGADINAVDHDGDGVLRYALTSKNPRIFEMLLDGGADPDAPCTSALGRASYSILHAVAEIGWATGLEALLRHGADVEPTRDGTSPLMLAAGGGRDSCIDLLNEAGADLQGVDEDGDSVLFYAASKGHKTTVARLLDLGANVNPSPGRSGLTPLTVAAHMASPVGRERPRAIPPSDYARIVVDLVQAGADATAMYHAGYVLQKQTTRGVEIAPLGQLVQMTTGDNSWSVGFLTEAGRKNNPHLLDPQPQKREPAKHQPTAQPHNVLQQPSGSRATTTVEVIGSTQTGFINKPTIKVYWNGTEIGRVEHGGRLHFDIDSDGEVRFRYAFRSAKTQVTLAGATKIYLGWDRTWGRLVASSDPRNIPQ